MSRADVNSSLKRLKKSAPIGAGKAALFLATIICSPMVHGQEASALYVSESGSNSNPGTKNAPLKTVEAALALAKPGTFVYLREGIYNQEIRVENKNGSPDAYITVANAPGEKVIIDRRFSGAYGVKVYNCRYVRITGLEIQNLLSDSSTIASGIIVYGKSHQIRIDHNTIRRSYGDAIKGGRNSTGIRLVDSDQILVEQNTIHDVTGHGESMGIKVEISESITIKRNLICFTDKSAIRLVTYDTDQDSFVDENITLYSGAGIDINNARAQGSKKIYVRNNFMGWNWRMGLQNKHTRNTIMSNNTFVGSDRFGLDLHGGSGSGDADVHYPKIKNNIFSDNDTVWEIYDRDVFEEVVDYNFYHYDGSLYARIFGGVENVENLQGIRNRTSSSSSVEGTYEVNGKEGNPNFVDPTRGDYRLGSNSSAAAAGESGVDIGASASALTKVGANEAFGLGNIPILGQVDVQVTSVITEISGNQARNAFDRDADTYWETLAGGEIEFRLNGDGPLELSHLTIIKFLGSGVSQYHYKRFEVHVDRGDGSWQRIPDPEGHPFTGYEYKYANGEIWALPEGTLAERMRIRIVDGHGSNIRIPEIRLHAAHQELADYHKRPSAPRNLRLISSNN